MGQKFWTPPYYSQRAVFASLRALFSFDTVTWVTGREEHLAIEKLDVGLLMATI